MTPKKKLNSKQKKEKIFDTPKVRLPQVPSTTPESNCNCNCALELKDLQEQFLGLSESFSIFLDAQEASQDVVQEVLDKINNDPLSIVNAGNAQRATAR